MSKPSSGDGLPRNLARRHAWSIISKRWKSATVGVSAQRYAVPRCSMKPFNFRKCNGTDFERWSSNFDGEPVSASGLYAVRVVSLRRSISWT